MLEHGSAPGEQADEDEARHWNVRDARDVARGRGTVEEPVRAEIRGFEPFAVARHGTHRANDGREHVHAKARRSRGDEE